MKLKMMRNQKNFSIFLLQILLTAITVQCKNAETFDSEFEQFKQTIFAMKDLDVSKVIRGIVFSNWTDNRECLVELNAIKRARRHNEEWAYKSKLDFSFHLILVLFD